MKSFLFKPEMLKAFVEGRKTLTSLLHGLKEINENPGDWYCLLRDKLSGDYLVKCKITGKQVIVKPRFQVGDKFYCKEGYWVDSKWKSHLLMPEWAARYFGEITSVKLDRLQNMTEKDAVDEGVDYSTGHADKKEWTRINSFIDLWDSTNKVYTWEKNPWVWTYGIKLTAYPVNS